MTDQPAQFSDRTALTRNRQRSREDAMFLHELAIYEVQDRLEMVNKSFTSPALVTGFPDFWAQRFPQETQIVADEAVLDLAPGAHDLVVHGMALHWADDPVGQLIQCRRALKPDGLFLCVLLGGQTLNELRACLSDAEIQMRGGLSPRVAPMADIRDLGALLQRAGFALPVADSMPQKVEYDDSYALMADLRAMGEANAQAARVRHFSGKSLFAKADHIYRTNFAGTQKPISASFELVTLTGWAPDASQPQPLRPGSAQARLADVLGVDEKPLPD